MICEKCFEQQTIKSKMHSKILKQSETQHTKTHGMQQNRAQREVNAHVKKKIPNYLCEKKDILRQS